MLIVTYFVPETLLVKYHNKHTVFSEQHFPIKSFTVNTPSDSNNYENLNQQSVIGVQLPEGTIIVENNPSTTPFWILAFIVLFIPYFIWSVFGSEKSFVVPKYLHTLPNKDMSAWEVDMLTNGSDKLSKNGLASIMLELNVMKVITFSERKSFFKKISVFTINKDYYKLLEGRPKLLECVNLLLTKKVKESPKGIVCEIASGDRLFGLGMRSFVKDSSVKKKFFDSTGDNLFTGFVVIYFIVLYYTIITLYGGFFFNPYIFFIFLTGVRFVAIPKSIFSRFKENYYKNYLEWLSFKAMLDDYAQIKKYLKEDYAQWKSWLVYGTALGSAHNVLKNLKEASIISTLDYEKYSRYHSSMLVFAAVSMRSSNSGGGFGGAGGGFGGGGGGGR